MLSFKLMLLTQIIYRHFKNIDGDCIDKQLFMFFFFLTHKIYFKEEKVVYLIAYLHTASLSL